MARLMARRTASIATMTAICASTLLTAAGASAAAPAGHQAATPAVRPAARSAQPIAPPGSNLLVNPGADAGDTSRQGWDAVTIPGWRIRQGLPTVVSYGTRGFPPAADAGTQGRGDRVFAGGAGGTAVLTQQIPLRTAAGGGVRPGTRFRISAWLGGTAVSKATFAVVFRSGTGKTLGERSIGPVGGSGDASHPDFARRQGSGVLPAGTRSAEAELTLWTSLKNYNGPDAPLVGYDRAVAGSLSLSVGAQARRAVLTPPAARVPRYQHVFLFYFENEDFHQVIGNTRQAPYLNSLLPHASLLGQFYAEEHPSDGNYLALAGGSTFGVPLDDPAEENPLYTIDARNLGDLVDAAHETWKGYLQSAAGPCDNTVHGYYWDDDLPMMYFADVRGQPSYCASHMVPLPELATDLKQASTTPDFAWVSPDDCFDIESCGIKAGDDFLKAELRLIMRSPAWTRQRSLAIITFDEDNTDYQHPAQRVATIVLGSRGVRPGYTSPVRYTHYSLLRTIEAALGLGTLTRNDLYAQPLNDIFAPSVTVRAGVAPLTAPAVASAATPQRAARATGAAARDPGPTAFVVNYASDTVTPVSMARRRAEPAIGVGSFPSAIAITPDGTTAYVVNYGSDTVTPIATATGAAGAPIGVGEAPNSIAITPNGATAYVVDGDTDAVTAIATATGTAGPPVSVGYSPVAVAVSRAGTTAYVVNVISGTVTPLSTSSGRAAPALPVGLYDYPTALMFGLSASSALVIDTYAGQVTPVDVAIGHVYPAVTVGGYPVAAAISP
jgi:YVTN family beta-propeller protein